MTGGRILRAWQAGADAGDLLGTFEYDRERVESGVVQNQGRRPGEAFNKRLDPERGLRPCPEFGHGHFFFDPAVAKDLKDHVTDTEGRRIAVRRKGLASEL
jgi:hypothetical protein